MKINALIAEANRQREKNYKAIKNIGGYGAKK